MTDMPRRPREHELGDEAVRVFAGVLGSRLAFYERPQPEYGIDGDVEEFDSDRRVTGMHFFVQIKGTDEPDLHQALACSLPMKTANYYRAASMPVLMVRYHSPTGRIYVRWFHQYDPYYGRGGQEFLTFRWQPGDVWDDTTALTVTAEANAFYAIRGAGMGLPQQLFVEVNGTAGVAQAQLRIACRKLASRAAGIVEVRGGSREAGALWIELRPDALVAHVASVASATMHFPDSIDSSTVGIEQLARDGMVLLALAFERHGQDRAAAELATCYLEGSSLIHEHDVVLALTRSMSKSGRIGEAISLSERVDDPDEPSASEASFLLSLAPILGGRAIEERDAERYEQLLKLRVKRRKHDHVREAGAAARNLAIFLRRQRRHDKAVDHYRRAAKFDPDMESDASYWTSLAGSLWMIGSFRRSAEAYARAVELASDDLFLVALHGDALLFAGEYARAAEEFERFVQSGAAGDDGEYRIKAFAVPYLVKRLGIDSQQRETGKALQAIEGADAVDHAGWAAVSLAQLSHDALWGSAWLNLAVAERAAGNDEDALVCDLLSTFLIPGDITAWSNAINASIAADEPVLCQALFTVGQRIAGPALTELLVQQAESLDGELRQAFLEIIDHALEQDETRRAASVEESILSENGSFELAVGLYRHDLGDSTDDEAAT
jgi:tetratricopeptide (TPR) repeat protein